MQHLRQVLETLRKHELYIKRSKCEFAVSALKFLGHVISDKGITMDPDKVKAILDWPEPTGTPAQCKTQLKGFLGLANFNRRMVDHFAEPAAPLNALTADKTEWIWEQPQKDAFAALKRKMTEVPHFVHAPHPTARFIVETDASQVATGAVIYQRPNPPRVQVIAYSSHKLQPNEALFPAHEREMLAVNTALTEWRHFLLGRLFDLYTDNEAVTKFLKQPSLTPRQARWVQKLSEYDFNLYHLPGPRNLAADALSRRPDHYPGFPAQTAAQIHVRCARTLEDVTNKLLVLNNTNLPSLSPVRNSGPLSLNAFFDQLRADAEFDQEYTSVLTAAQEGELRDFTEKDGLVWYTPCPEVTPRLYVPHGQERELLLKEAHDTPTRGHLGIHKTHEALHRRYYWPHMFHTVSLYVAKCATCACTKPSNKQPMGLLQPLPLPDHCWEQVSHDIITGLPKTPRGHDAIVTFVDRLSKRVIFVPSTCTIDAAGYAELFFKEIFRHFGLPKVIVSDRDPRFTSHFWRALHKRLGTNLKMSTAHHPQTDGQTERANRTVEDMLRAYTTPFQHNWDEYLVPAEFAYNNSLQASTGFTPFYLNHGRHPHTPLSLLTDHHRPTASDTNPAANDFVGRFQTNISRAKDALYRAQQRQQRYADQHRRHAEFSVGDQVLLSTKYLSLHLKEGTTPKLCPKFTGPFKITTHSLLP